ncbi:MAG: hypothetical protein IJ223_07265 [Clostridia bacterium]|nr:hypothetical protein [Clostridia bacterium]
MNNKTKKYIAIVILFILCIATLSLKSMAVFITDMNSNAEFGIIKGSYRNYGHQLHYCTYDGKTYMLFCTQFGVKSPTGREYTYDDEFVLEYKYNYEKYQKLAEMVYFGYAMKHGTGLPINDEAKSAMCCTQQYVWEYIKNNIDSNAKVVGRDSWNTSYMTSTIYDKWLTQTEKDYKDYHSNVEFNGNKYKVNIGESLELLDSAEILKNYDSFNKTIDGVNFFHEKGSNVLIVTSIAENDSGIVTFNSKDYGLYELMPNGNAYSSATMSNYIYFKFKSDTVQNLLFSNYINPNSFNISVEVQSGKIIVKKLNNMNDPVAGCNFEVYSNETCTNKIVSGVSNNAGEVIFNKLKPGIYYVKEVSASSGYSLEKQVKKVEVLADNASKVEFINTEPTGTISIIKQLDESVSVLQGDASFENAKYNIYAKEDIYNVAKTKKFYSKGDLVATRIMNKEGKTEDITDLPLGKYMVKEVESPKGYMLDLNEYEVDLGYKDENTKLVTATVTSKEKVKQMKIHIFKSGIRALSGKVPGLEGTTFTIKLKSDMQKALDKGFTYEELWNENIEEVPNYAIITTDSDGNAYTDYLPYGEYIVKETITPKDYETAEDFVFEIAEDESEIPDVTKKVKNIFVNNEQLEAYLKIIKKDKATGKLITASSAIFQIKAVQDVLDRASGTIIYKEGELVSQKIGNTLFNSFSTNSENIIVIDNNYLNSNDEKGNVVTPLKLPVGKYEIVEIKAPEGFLKLDKPIQFEISNIQEYKKDKDGSYIKEIVIENENPIGIIQIDKSIVVTNDENTSILDDSDLSKIEFKLTAKEDILNNVDNSIIYKAGEKIDTYNLSKDGSLKIENLPLGIYELQEVKTIEGLVLDNSKYEIKLAYENSLKKVYEVSKSISNSPTIVEFSKTDITGTEELIGAKLELINKQGKIIDTWISASKPHKIEGLIVGEKYILREITAPTGYELAEEIEFTVKDTSETQFVQMKDKPIIIEEPPQEPERPEEKPQTELPPKLPKTGDENDIFFVFIFEISIFILALSIKRKLKKV